MNTTILRSLPLIVTCFMLGVSCSSPTPDGSKNTGQTDEWRYSSKPNIFYGDKAPPPIEGRNGFTASALVTNEQVNTLFGGQTTWYDPLYSNLLVTKSGDVYWWGINERWHHAYVEVGFPFEQVGLPGKSRNVHPLFKWSESLGLQVAYPDLDLISPTSALLNMSDLKDCPKDSLMVWGIQKTPAVLERGQKKPAGPPTYQLLCYRRNAESGLLESSIVTSKTEGRLGPYTKAISGEAGQAKIWLQMSHYESNPYSANNEELTGYRNGMNLFFPFGSLDLSNSVFSESYSHSRYVFGPSNHVRFVSGKLNEEWIIGFIPSGQIFCCNLKKKNCNPLNELSFKFQMGFRFPIRIDPVAKKILMATNTYKDQTGKTVTGNLVEFSYVVDAKGVKLLTESLIAEGLHKPAAIEKIDSDYLVLDAAPNSNKGNILWRISRKK